MANVLKCYFKDAGGKEISISYNYVKDGLTGATVRALMEGMVANAAIYATPPVELVAAEVVVTSTTPIAL